MAFILFAMNWRKIQKENFTKLQDLISFLAIDEVLQKKIYNAPHFILNVPKRLADKMAKNNADDPIFRQFVPLTCETLPSPGFVLDPVQDHSFCKTSKMLQKYQGRVLLLTTSACAMNCRFCFRQNFPYETERRVFEEEIALIAQDPSIREVILSGGDPLSLSNDALFSLFAALETIPHVRRIRFHTRFPVGIPERIDEGFLQGLKTASKQVFFLIHCNHPKELDNDVIASLQKIMALKIPVLSQTVLLRGVNDEEATLLLLMETFVNCGIVPYYLHQLDPVKGTAHFAVSDERALTLHKFLQENISGYAVPRLVQEEPGRKSKTILFPNLCTV